MVRMGVVKLCVELEFRERLLVVERRGDVVLGGNRQLP